MLAGRIDEVPFPDAKGAVEDAPPAVLDNKGTDPEPLGPP